MSLRERHNNTSAKYQTVLKLVNSILANIGHNQIDDLTKFIDIDRRDIIKQHNIDALLMMEDDLFPLFDKMMCGFYRKNGKAYVLNCMRGLLKDIGYDLSHRRKEITTTFNGEHYRKSYILYSIK